MLIRRGTRIVMRNLPGEGTSSLRFNRSDNGKSAVVRVGETFAVELHENPTTGYHWEVEKDNSSIVTLRESRYIRDTDSTVGSGGLRLFTFEAIKPGTTTLTLTQQRPGQAISLPDERYSITVNVAAS